jgi:hypothetical protein
MPSHIAVPSALPTGTILVLVTDILHIHVHTIPLPPNHKAHARALTHRHTHTYTNISFLKNGVRIRRKVRLSERTSCLVDIVCECLFVSAFQVLKLLIDFRNIRCGRHVDKSIPKT